MEKNCKYEEEELLEKEFQSQVMNMKQKYGEIPVPAHARDRMLAGIRQAKEEKERSVVALRANVTELRAKRN